MSRWDDEPIGCGVILLAAALICATLATTWGVIA